MTSKKRKTYEQLSQSSKTSFVNHYDKMVKAGKNITQVKRMNLKQYNDFFHLGKRVIRTNESLKGQKSRLNQIAHHINEVNNDYFKKEKIINKNLKEAFLKESYELFNIKKEKQVEKIDQIDDSELLDLPSKDKEGKYGLIKLTNLANGEEFFIKFKDKKSLDKQLSELKKKYRISSFYSEFLDVKQYKSHITKEFIKEIEKVIS